MYRIKYAHNEVLLTSLLVLETDCSPCKQSVSTFFEISHPRHKSTWRRLESFPLWLCWRAQSRSLSWARLFCDASHLYHKIGFVRNSLMIAPPPQPLDVSLCRVEHGNLTKAMAAWRMSESRTQNFRDTLFLYHENSSTGL